MKQTAIAELQKAVNTYYRQHGRDLPWRRPETDGSFDPYKILVSELMLQQTQVNRVIPKYEQFLEVFPTVRDLAEASLGDVLRLWSGLGYNRRAKFLWQAAQMVVSQWHGVFPSNQQELVKLPGVGLNTAGAICAYAFNQPAIFIETNIRTVFFTRFWSDRTKNVDDKELRPLIEASLAGQDPRTFYWALMDYGTHLKATRGNNIRQSKHYTKQSKFQGSKRQIRGQILRELTKSELPQERLQAVIGDDRFDDILKDLVQEGLVWRQGQILSLA